MCDVKWGWLDGNFIQSIQVPLETFERYTLKTTRN